MFENVRLVCMMLALACLICFAHAEVREAIGYGSGDNLEQAISVAQGDAVLNAGGKAVSETEVAKDKLLKDVVCFSNEVYLVDSTLIENGESFDGTYARVKVHVTSTEDLSKKDGVKMMEGVGHAQTEQASTMMAIGDLLFNAGKKIKAVGEFKNEDVVKDEVTVSGSGYIEEVKVNSSQKKDKEFIARVSASILPYQEWIKNDKLQVKAVANGTELPQLIAKARRDAVSPSGAGGYSFSEVYNSGTLTRATMEKTALAWCRGFSAKIEEDANGECSVLIEGEISRSKDNLDDAAIEAIGYGGPTSDCQSIETARFDSLLGYQGRVRVASRFEHGKRVNDQLDVSTHAFVKVLDRGEKFGATYVKARVGKDAVSVLGNDENKDVHGFAVGRSFAEAFSKAKYDVIMDGGLLIDADMGYSNGVLSSCEAKGAASGTLGQLVIDEVKQVESGEQVSVCARVGLPGNVNRDEPVTTKGYGFGKDQQSSLVLARCDALLNAGSSVDKELSFRLGEEASGKITLTGHGFVGPAIHLDSMPNGLRLEVEVADTPAAVLKTQTFKSKGEGVGTTVADAVASARFNAVYNSGMVLDVTSELVNGRLEQCSAAGSRTVRVRGCHDVKISRNGDAYKATLEMCLTESESSCAAASKTVGYGVSRSFDEARKFARADAVLNAKSEMSQSYQYKDGECEESNSSISGDCIYFGEDLSVSNEKGQCVVKVNAKLGDRHSSLSTGKGREVSSKGYGRTKDLAIADAKRNAIDSVFGRHIKVTSPKADVGGSEYDITENAFADGYIAECKVKNAEETSYGWTVKLKAVVQQRGCKQREVSIFAIVVAGLVLLLILMVVIAVMR